MKNKLNKYLKISIILTWSLCSILFLGTIIYFLYNTINYRNKLSKMAYDLYLENPNGALAILSETTSISTEFMAIIISIFAIVVSVWVGLNIYNILSKDELDTLKNDVDVAFLKTKEKEIEIDQFIDQFVKDGYFESIFLKKI